MPDFPLPEIPHCHYAEDPAVPYEDPDAEPGIYYNEYAIAVVQDSFTGRTESDPPPKPGATWCRHHERWEAPIPDELTASSIALMLWQAQRQFDESVKEAVIALNEQGGEMVPSEAVAILKPLITSAAILDRKIQMALGSATDELQVALQASALESMGLRGMMVKDDGTLAPVGLTPEEELTVLSSGSMEHIERIREAIASGDEFPIVQLDPSEFGLDWSEEDED